VSTIKTAAVIVLLLGIVGLGIGGAFVGIGFAKNNQIATYLRAEKVTLGLSAADIAKGKVVDNLTAAQNAAETLTKHRQSIAPTYNDLLAGKPFDPTNLTQLKYVQAMNLQTNIYTAVLAFGLAQSIMANGAFMIATGIAFIVVGIVLYKLAKKPV
jgi:acyl CoA:acetate/3-ketoacid CoA transferase beta subunit